MAVIQPPLKTLNSSLADSLLRLKRGAPPKYPTHPLPDFTNKSPRRVVVLDTDLDVQDWRDVLIGTCMVVRKKRPADFARILELRGPKRLWFSRNPTNLRDPTPIDDTGIYAETNLSANGLAMTCQNILAHFEFEPDIRVETR